MNTDEAASPRMNKAQLEKWIQIVICGNASKVCRSPLSTAIANELRESAGFNKPRLDYVRPLNTLIKDLEDLRASLLKGEEPKGW